MATTQKQVTVGTTPVLAIAATKGRKGWRVTFVSSGIIAGNTGTLHVGRNFPPGTTTGDPNSGDLLQSSGEVKENKQYADDVIFEGDVWLTASIATQIVNTEETV